MDLKEIEKKTYLTYLNDGLMDLFIGLFILLFAIGMKLDKPVIAAISSALFLPLYKELKKTHSHPVGACGI